MKRKFTFNLIFENLLFIIIYNRKDIKKAFFIISVFYIFLFPISRILEIIILNFFKYF